jgi:hypothetical protein
LADWPFALTDGERKLGYAGLFRKYVDPDVARARAGIPERIVAALGDLDRYTPGAWLRARGASAAAADVITLGFGTDFGSAASFVLHGVNTQGSAENYRVDGGNDQLPRAFASRVAMDRLDAWRTGVGSARRPRDQRLMRTLRLARQLRIWNYELGIRTPRRVVRIIRTSRIQSRIL